MKITWQEQDEKKLATKARELIQLKTEYREKYGQPHRYKIKNSYKEIEKYLLDHMPYVYEIDGHILTKGANITAEKTIPYVMMYTQESWQKARKYLNDN